MKTNISLDDYELQLPPSGYKILHTIDAVTEPFPLTFNVCDSCYFDSPFFRRIENAFLNLIHRLLSGTALILPCAIWLGKTLEFTYLLTY